MRPIYFWWLIAAREHCAEALPNISYRPWRSSIVTRTGTSRGRRMADQVIDSLLGSACVVPHGYRLGWPPDCEEFQGLVTAATAGVTAIQLWPLVSKGLEPPSPSALQEANAKRQRVLEEKDGALRPIHRLSDSAPDQTVIINRGGESLRGNRRMKRLFEYSCNAPAGRSVEPLRPDRPRPRSASALPTSNTGNEHNGTSHRACRSWPDPDRRG